MAASTKSTVKKTTAKNRTSVKTGADTDEKTAADFTEKLKGLMELAHANKDVLETDKVNDYFKDSNLSVQQIEKIYEYLDMNGITVMNMNDMDDDLLDDDFLPEADEDAQSELNEELSAAVMSDDPVKLYLKEIGN